MPFPASERVIYDRNPLVGVTFHARFSRLLEVDSELPTTFQKAILSDYPLLEEREIYRITVSNNASDNAPTSERGKIYDFLSEEKIWKASLGSDSIALTTSKYRTWEDFRARLTSLLNHFWSVYQVPYFTRIGLKYQNMLVREDLELAGVPWKELLGAHFASELTDNAFSEDEYQIRQSYFRILLDNKDSVQVTHGLAVSLVCFECQGKGMVFWAGL
jgi:uncharacterized protein (TIGR04255 family)